MAPSYPITAKSIRADLTKSCPWWCISQAPRKIFKKGAVIFKKNQKVLSSQEETRQTCITIISLKIAM